jgi:hypothetical protein
LYASPNLGTSFDSNNFLKNGRNFAIKHLNQSADRVKLNQMGPKSNQTSHEPLSFKEQMGKPNDILITSIASSERDGFIRIQTMGSDSSRVNLVSASSARNRVVSDLEGSADEKRINFKVSRIKHVFEKEEIYRQLNSYERSKRKKQEKLQEKSLDFVLSSGIREPPKLKPVKKQYEKISTIWTS